MSMSKKPENDFSFLAITVLLSAWIFAAVGIVKGHQQEKISCVSIEQSTLRECAEEVGIWIGTISGGYIWERDELYKSIFAKEFNSGVVMVHMKNAQPRPNKFNFHNIDKVRKFAREHNIKLVGSSLIYSNELSPSWLKFNQIGCGGWSREELDQIMQRFIQTMVSHGGDDFHAWNVVNEPLSRNAEKRCWYKILGEEYIDKAFYYAHEANPTALLILNENFGRGGVDLQKANDFFALITRLKESDVPVHVAGIQMHLLAHRLRPTYQEEFEDFLERAQAVGVQVHVTEMEVYQGPSGFFREPYQKQKEVFQNIVSTCLAFSHCTTFITWGLTDKYNWLKTRILHRYPDAKPLLFDENYYRKPAYFGVLEALQAYKPIR